MANRSIPLPQFMQTFQFTPYRAQVVPRSLPQDISDVQTSGPLGEKAGSAPSRPRASGSPPRPRPARPRARPASTATTTSSPSRTTRRRRPRRSSSPWPSASARTWSISKGSVKGLRRSSVLIEDLTFKLPPGGIVGVIGPNGAGKTTLFRMITKPGDAGQAGTPSPIGDSRASRLRRPVARQRSTARRQCGRRFPATTS